jgi:2-polyprenyl-3-methyl-5-hydroxy-6-metoxy-1,4-benzoquinol methylase
LDDWGQLAHDPLRSAVNADDIQAHDQDDRRAGPPEQRVFFDPLARAYERFADAQDEFYRPWLSAAIPNRGGDPASRAVDLGCGSGRFATLLADRHAEVLAVDIAERELAIARAKRARPNISYEHRSLLDVTPGVDGRFDVVLSVNAIHHLLIICATTTPSSRISEDSSRQADWPC